MKTALRVLTILPFAVLGAAMIFFIVSYGGLPEKIGVHFGPDGDFDVIADKIFGFYPFVAGFGLMFLFLLGSFLSGRIKLGMKMTQKGEGVMRTAIKLYAIVLMWLWSLFFTRWTYSVITQTPNDITFLSVITMLFVLSLPVIIIAAVVIRIIFRRTAERT